MRAKVLSICKFPFETPETFVRYYWYILLFGTKIYLIYFFRSLFKHTDVLWFSSFFFYEICMVIFIYGLSYSFTKFNFNATCKRITVFCIYFIVTLITIIVYSLVFTSIYEIGFIINWYTSICNMVLLENDAGLAWDSIPVFIFFSTIQFALVFIGIIISCFLKRHAEYIEKIPDASAMDTSHTDIKIITEPQRKFSRIKCTGNLCKVSFAILTGIYLFITFLICPQQNFLPIISKGPLVTLVIDLNSFYYLRCKQIEVDLETGGTPAEWLETCRTLNEAFIQARSQNRTCFNRKKYITDFSFIKRNPSSQIKNVVLIYLESTRADVNPFNYEGFLARTLNEDTKRNRDITPFMDNLVKKSLYTTKGRSVCSYTIKSMLAGLCSTYPFPKSYISEHNYELPRTCLPELLRKYGNFSTAYFEPMNLAFDSHDHLFKNRIKFDHYFTGEHIQRGEAGRGFAKLGFMHHEDRALMNPMLNWIDEVTEQQKPFFIFYSSGTTHHKWNTPSSYSKKTYTKPGVSSDINNYFNTIRYMDDFLKDLFENFEKRGLTSNTLFIFFGDHGVSMGEHGMWITTDIPYETQFNVPAIIYTENKEFQKKFPPTKFNDTWSNLDILPTILDALRIKDHNSKLVGEYVYEGQSMLRENFQERLQLGLANPGFSYITFKEGDRKVIFPEIPNKNEEYYNITSDPYEITTFSQQELDEGFKYWVGSMRIMRALYINKTMEWYKNGTLAPNGSYSIDYFEHRKNHRNNY